MSRSIAEQPEAASSSDRAPTSLGAISRAVSSFSSLSSGLSRLRIGIDMGSGAQHHHSLPEGSSVRAEQAQSSDIPAASEGLDSQAHSDPRDQQSALAQAGSGAASPPEAPSPPTYQSLEPGLSNWIERNSPIVGLFMVVFLHQNMIGISWCFCMSYLLRRGNELLRAQVSRNSELQRRKVRLLLLALPAGVTCALIARHPLKLWRMFILLPPNASDEFWDQLFAVALADICIRLVTATIKAAVVVACPAPTSASTVAGKHRARILTLVEHASLLYRCMTPSSTWYRYFDKAALPAYLSHACAGLYLGSKGFMLYDRLKCVAASASLALWAGPAYGQPATREEVMEAGNSCAICQSTMEAPMKLSCNHIFCDGCISHWFDLSHSTCPMCRAVVRPSSVQSYGDGWTSMLPQLF